MCIIPLWFILVIVIVSFRFGSIHRIASRSQGRIIVEFSSRNEAEQAMKRGNSYGGKMLNIVWSEDINFNGVLNNTGVNSIDKSDDVPVHSNHSADISG